MLNIVFQKYLMKKNIMFGSALIKASDFYVLRYTIRLSSGMMACPCEAFKIINSTKYFMISEKTIT